MSNAPIPSSHLTRRSFLAATSSAASPALVSPRTAFGASANYKISLGLLGCCGRGKWIANLFQKHGGYELGAVLPSIGRSPTATSPIPS